MTDAILPDNLRALGDELEIAAQHLVTARKRRERTMRVAALAALSTLVLAGGAIAAERIFGDPAPEAVKNDIAAVDDGLPAEIRLNPHVTEAYSVAESETAVLYYAALDDGGYCTQLVINGKEHAAQCITAAQASSLPIAVTISTPDPGTTTDALTIAGRVNADVADHLAVAIGGDVHEVAMGDDEFFAFDLSASDVIAARASGFSIKALNAAGEQVAETDLSNIFAEAPPSTEPIEVTYRSNERDLSLLLGLDGHATDPKITSLELRYPDGEIQEISLAPNREFHLGFSNARIDDFADAVGVLIGRDASGKVVAKRPVASVAYFRAAERSGVFERATSDQ